MNREFISRIISSALPVFECCLVQMISNVELPKLICSPTQPIQKLQSANPSAQYCFQGFNSQPQLLFKYSPQNRNRIPVQNRSDNKTGFLYRLPSLHTWAVQPWLRVLLCQLMDGWDTCDCWGCKTKASSRWYLWKPLNPFPMGEKSNMFFLLQNPVEVYTADLTLAFYCLKMELLLCVDWTLRWPPSPWVWLPGWLRETKGYIPSFSRTLVPVQFQPRGQD